MADQPSGPRSGSSEDQDSDDAPTFGPFYSSGSAPFGPYGAAAPGHDDRGTDAPGPGHDPLTPNPYAPPESQTPAGPGSASPYATPAAPNPYGQTAQPYPYGQGSGQGSEAPVAPPAGANPYAYPRAGSGGGQTPYAHGTVTGGSGPAGPDNGARTLGIVGVVLGGLGLIFGLMDDLWGLGWLLLLAALVVGIVALVRSRVSKAWAIGAMVLSLVGMFASLVAIGVRGTDDTGDSAAGGTSAPSVGSSARSAASVTRFGEAAKLDSGVSVAVGRPTSYTPGKYAATRKGTYDPDNGKAVQFSVTITNGGSKNFDPSIFDATANSGGQEALTIIDDTVGLPPRTTLTPGKSVTFPVAFQVKDPSDVTMDVEVDFDHDPVTFQ